MRLNIKEAREKRGLTQEELSARLGFSQNAVSGWERGIREPKLEVIVQIADLCNVSIDFLFGREAKIETFGEHTAVEKQHDMAEGLKALEDNNGINVSWESPEADKIPGLRGVVEETVRQVLAELVRNDH